MPAPVEQDLEIAIREIQRGQCAPGRYEPVTVASNRGDIRLRHYPVSGAQHALICIGADGWASPAGGLYPRLCAGLQAAGIAGLQVRLRQPGALAESALDVLVALHFLSAEGATRFALVGDGFAGAVAAQAAANADDVRALVTLGTQLEGLEAVAALPRGCASLFIHGEEDGLQPATASHYGYKLARDPRYLRIFGGAGHALDEVADELGRELGDWLLAELQDAPTLTRRVSLGR